MRCMKERSLERVSNTNKFFFLWNIFCAENCAGVNRYVELLNCKGHCIVNPQATKFVRSCDTHYVFFLSFRSTTSRFQGNL